MNRRKDCRVSIIFLSLSFVAFMLQQLNEWLALSHLHLYLDGLLLLFPALYLRPMLGLWIIVFFSLCREALLLQPFGTMLTAWLLAYLVLQYFRPRIRRENSQHLLVMVQLANLLITGIYIIRFTGGSWQAGIYWESMGLNLLLSHLLLFFITTPVINWQYEVLQTFGIDLGSELQQFD